MKSHEDADPIYSGLVFCRLLGDAHVLATGGTVKGQLHGCGSTLIDVLLALTSLLLWSAHDFGGEMTFPAG